MEWTGSDLTSLPFRLWRGRVPRVKRLTSALFGLPLASLRGFGFQFVQIKSRIYVWWLKADCESTSAHSLTTLKTSDAASDCSTVAGIWPPGGIQELVKKCSRFLVLKGVMLEDFKKK